MLWWIVGTVLAVLVAAVSIVVGIGLILPRDHIAERSLELDAPPARVWEAITDAQGAPRWRSGLRDVQALPPLEGRRHWSETGKDGTLRFVEDEAQPPRRLVVRIADPDLPFGGRWVYALEPLERGTRLTIREEGEVYNPVFRFVSHFILGHYATLDAYLRDLGAHLGTHQSAAQPPASPRQPDA